MKGITWIDSAQDYVNDSEPVTDFTYLEASLKALVGEEKVFSENFFEMTCYNHTQGDKVVADAVKLEQDMIRRNYFSTIVPLIERWYKFVLARSSIVGGGTLVGLF